MDQDMANHDINRIKKKKLIVDCLGVDIAETVVNMMVFEIVWTETNHEIHTPLLDFQRLVAHPLSQSADQFPLSKSIAIVR